MDSWLGIAPVTVGVSWLGFQLVRIFFFFLFFFFTMYNELQSAWLKSWGNVTFIWHCTFQPDSSQIIRRHFLVWELTKQIHCWVKRKEKLPHASVFFLVHLVLSIHHGTEDWKADRCSKCKCCWQKIKERDRDGFSAVERIVWLCFPANTIPCEASEGSCSCHSTSESCRLFWVGKSGGNNWYLCILHPPGLHP